MRADVPAVGTYYVARHRVLDADDRRRSPTRSPRTRTPAPAARRARDCAAEYRNQIFRGDCVAGACVAIEGDGAVAEGGACDSAVRLRDAACRARASSSSPNADTRERLRARPARNDTECGPLGTDYVCTTYLHDELLRPEVHQRRPVPDRRSTRSPTSGPWYRLTLSTLATGRCVARDRVLV